MRDHLTREEISTLLDEPGAVRGGRAHVDECGECAREYEQMSRMRMALSALPELAPPAREWERVAERLGVSPRGRARGLSRVPPWLHPAWAAAVVTLFAAGLGVGRLLSPATGGADGMPSSAVTGEPAPAEGDGARVADGTLGPAAGSGLARPGTAPGPAAEYLRTVAGLQELRDDGPSRGEIRDDPVVAAERLMELDALIEASREALRSAPADPVLNNFLFDVVAERESVAGHLDRTLRLTSVEY